MNSTVVNDNYINNGDKHLPVMRVSVLVTADNYSNKKINDSIVTNDANGDLTKNNNADLVYDKIILGDNPRDYYYGKMNNKDLNGYYTNDSHMVYVCLLYTSRCV